MEQNIQFRLTESSHPHAEIAEICAKSGIWLEKGMAAKIYAEIKTLERDAVIQKAASLVQTNSVRQNQKRLEKERQRQARSDAKEQIRAAAWRIVEDYSLGNPADAIRRIVKKYADDALDNPEFPLETTIREFLSNTQIIEKAKDLIPKASARARTANVIIASQEPNSATIAACGCNIDKWLVLMAENEASRLAAIDIESLITPGSILYAVIAPDDFRAAAAWLKFVEKLKAVKSSFSTPKTIPEILLRSAAIAGVTAPDDLATAFRARTDECNKAAKRRKVWEASLVNAADAKSAIGATKTEFDRWVDEGRIPVAKRKPFRNWGKNLEAPFYDPTELAALRPLLPTWRTEHEARLAERRKASTQKALASRRAAADLRRETGLSNYAALFPAARAMTRQIIFNVGPTNSGKTHTAMDALAAAQSGAYVAPLRLMALEAFERLNEERGVPCSLSTGEERIETDNAGHVACTVEMTSFSTRIDVAVIDEIQMLTDPNRGWAWTAALAGVPAKTVVLTGSEDALPWIESVLAMTGERFEIRRFERKTTLSVLPKAVGLHDLTAGDAVIAFSRGDVLRLRGALIDAGKSVAVIYGALGPDVRRKESARFRSGAADILVATDAIGMGLNLPIKRVIFSDMVKFDGVTRRELTFPEIRQIGGRAGRFGIHEEGSVGVMPGVNLHIARQRIDAALSGAGDPSDDIRPYIMLPRGAARAVADHIGSERLADILGYFSKTILPKTAKTRAANIDDALAIADCVDQSGLDLGAKLSYLGAPLDAKNGEHVCILGSWAKRHAGGQAIPSPEIGAIGTPSTSESLESVELNAKLLTLYLWLALRWPDIYTDYREAFEARQRCNAAIEEALARKGLKRTCRDCGQKLPFHHAFPICDFCYSEKSRRYDRFCEVDDDFDDDFDPAPRYTRAQYNAPIPMTPEQIDRSVERLFKRAAERLEKDPSDAQRYIEGLMTSIEAAVKEKLIGRLDPPLAEYARNALAKGRKK